MKAFYLVCAIAGVFALALLLEPVYKAIRSDIHKHNEVMRDIAVEAKEEARWNFLRECTRKNKIKDCEER